jgi:hypothetical protein
MSSFRALVVGTCCSLAAAASAYAQTYDLPFKAEHFDDGDLKILWGRAKHSDSGVQEHGYDLGAVRYDSNAKKWTELTVSDADYAKNKTNNRWVLYGKPVHAMRDGKVIACWRNAPENPPGGEHPKIDEGFVYGGGNGFWIEHSDGTRVEYAHMIPGSVPAGLCPHSASLLPAKIASPAVGNAWPHIRVPAAQQVTVKRGQLLGQVGNSGTSSNPHLHIHLEQGGTAGTTKSGGSPVVINFTRGLSAPKNDAVQDVTWKTFAGKPIPAGPVLVWPPRTLVAEYARHGFPAGAFQDLFDHLTDSGFWLVWIDTYNVGGKDFINHVWRPAAAPWRAHFLVTGQTHQSNTDTADKEGYAAILVESSVSGGQPRYSAVFVKGKPSDMIMRHGLTVQEHDAQLAAAKKRKLAPVSISVISIAGQRRYTVLYRPEPIGAWEMKSQIPEAGYQAEYNENSKAGRKPVYLNAYMHGGLPFISAVFASKPTAGRKDRHLMSAQEYQQEWAGALKAGTLTHVVTSVDGAQTAHRFAASWWR